MNKKFIKLFYLTVFLISIVLITHLAIGSYKRNVIDNTVTDIQPIEIEERDERANVYNNTYSKKSSVNILRNGKNNVLENPPAYDDSNTFKYLNNSIRVIIPGRSLPYSRVNKYDTTDNYRVTTSERAQSTSFIPYTTLTMTPTTTYETTPTISPTAIPSPYSTTLYTTTLKTTNYVTTPKRLFIIQRLWLQPLLLMIRLLMIRLLMKQRLCLQPQLFILRLLIIQQL
jgi:hypothetical protein